MSLDYIRKNFVVCDEGDTTSNDIKNTSAFISIRKNIVVCNGGDTTSNAIKNTLALNSVHYL
jgi:hypothetical protein